MTAAIAVGVLVAAGVYLILQRGLVRVAFGFVLLGHAANVLLVAAGGMQRREPPLVGDGPAPGMADPLPQAFVLTAIVITFGITVYLLGLARAGGEDDPGPEVRDADPQPPRPAGAPEPDPAAAPDASAPSDASAASDADDPRETR